MTTPIDVQLRAAMLADAAVSAIIGTRFYFYQLSQNTGPDLRFPCCLYHRISTVPYYSHTVATNAEMSWIRFQIDCLAARKIGAVLAGLQVDALARAVTAALKTFNASVTPQSPTVLGNAPNFLINRRTQNDAQPQPLVYWEQLDVRIFGLETQ